MPRTALLCLSIACLAVAQDPFTPLRMEPLQGSPSMEDARDTWVRVTNQRYEMSGKTLRVAREGLSAIVLARGVEKPRHAKPILLGKGEYGLLFKTLVAAGFNRVVVRNPDTGKEWAARLEQGKAVPQF
jgi:hypothetical protein